MARPVKITPAYWAFLLALILLSGLVIALDANRPLFTWLNALGPALLWEHVTVLGDFMLWMPLLIIMLRYRPDFIRAVLLASVPATLWVHTLKPLLDLSRPLAALPEGAVRVIGPALQRQAFPSGHAATAFLLAGIVFLLFPNRTTRIMAIAAGLLIGISRAVVGVHWPVDILGGALGGWAAAGIGVWLGSKWAGGTGRLARIIFAAVLTVASLVLLLQYDVGYQGAAAMARGLAVFGLAAQILFCYRDWYRIRSAKKARPTTRR
jgi:membrane-associated phospholipid phosphatase